MSVSMETVETLKTMQLAWLAMRWHGLLLCNEATHTDADSKSLEALTMGNTQTFDWTVVKEG